jgi:sugar lactone lactonase YvrE
MRLQLSAATTVLAWGFAGGAMTILAACQGDDSTAAPASDASTARDSSSSTSDARAEAGGAAPTFLAHFAGQNPEGLWETAAGTPIVGYAGGATLVSVAGGATTTFSSLAAPGDAAMLNTFTLGITSDTTGNIYVGVAATGTPPNPAPGIYKIPGAGGVATLFSAASAVTPPMNFANGLDFMGGNLFVADSNGTIYKIVGTTGAASVWATDALLNPDMTACGGFDFAIGANGITHDATAFYVANTDFGRLVKIPIQTDGTAGTATALVDNCDMKGADGVAFDSVTNSVLVAVNIQNRIERVSLTGQRTVLFSGPPLDAPASLFLETTSSGRRLLFTNAAFFDTDPTAAQPGLLALPL